MGAFKSIYTDYACEPSQTLVSPKLTLEANSAGSLEFSVLPGQDGYNNIYTAPRHGYLVVLKDGEPIWDGRVTTRDMDWNNSKSIYAEGALSYLNDIMVQSLEDTGDFKTARANAQTDLKKKESAYNKAKKEWEDGGSVGTGDLYNKYITAKKNLGCAKKNYANCAYNANILDPTDDELLLELIEDDYYGENGPKIFEMMLEKYNAQAENSNAHNQFVLGDVFVPAIHEAYEAVDEDDYLIEWDSPDFTTVYEYFSSMLEKIPNTYLSVTYEYDENNLLVRKLNWLLQGVNKDNVEAVKEYYNTNVKAAKTAYSTAAKTYNKWYVKAYDSAKDSEDIDALIKSKSEYASKHNPLVTATNNLKTVNAAWNTYIKHLVDYSSPDIVVKQTVNFGENLLDFKRNIDSTEMFTRLIPIGEDDLYLNDDKSSNAIYVQDNDLVAQYGVITRKMNFDKIRDVKTLKQQAKAELAKMKARIDGSKESIEITALDLRYLDSNAYYGKSLNIYDVVDCISAPHGFVTSNKFPVLKEEIDMAQPENTKFTLNAITEYQSATSQLASTSASAMATASTVSTLGARQNTNITYIDDGGGGGTGGGNKIYTSKSAPDNTVGSEGDLWVKYFVDYNDKLVNSHGDEVEVNLPRYESADDAYNYVDLTIRPQIRSMCNLATTAINAFVKGFQGQISIAACQYDEYFITASQFPQLTVDTYTINDQSFNVSGSTNYIGWKANSAVYYRYIGVLDEHYSPITNLDDSNDNLLDNGLTITVVYYYLYYNTSNKKIENINGSINHNNISHRYWDDFLRKKTSDITIDLINTAFLTIDKIYCKIDDDWVSYDGDGGSTVVVNQILQSGTEIAQISVDGEVVSIYAPTVSATQTLSSGTEIGTVTVGSTNTTLYAPTPQSVSVTQTLASGTEIGSVTIDNNTTTLYAPTGGGSDVTVTPKTSTGTNIADIEVDGTTYSLFAPSGGGGEAIETAFIYSNEERVVGVWTDNKPLYQKTFNIQSNSQSRGMLEIPITDISTNIDNIIKFIGCTSNANYNRPVPLAYRYYEYSTITETLNVLYNKSSSKFVVYWRDIDFGTAYITIQYTKSTDTPGSGPYVTSGAYAHHYSTNEQVVGTWIDGSTLYEKTQYGGITFSVRGTWYDTDITNIDKIVSVEGSINRDGEPINLGYWNSSIISCWILRNHTLKMAMQAMGSGETYTLNSITVRYTKTS